MFRRNTIIGSLFLDHTHQNKDKKLGLNGLFSDDIEQYHVGKTRYKESSLDSNVGNGLLGQSPTKERLDNLNSKIVFGN